jgi:hypothetical protein
VWQQGGHPQNEGGPYRKRAAARAALRKRGGPKGGPQGRQAGPGGPSGRPSGQVAARRAARARPKGGQSRARGRPTGPPSRPDHSVKCAGSSKTGSGDLFLPIFFGVCVKDALFRPPRGPPPPPQAHQRPRPVKATTYRTPVPTQPSFMVRGSNTVLAIVWMELLPAWSFVGRRSQPAGGAGCRFTIAPAELAVSR